MCEECTSDPELREAWDIYHAQLAAMFIDAYGSADEFALRVGMYHRVFLRGWRGALRAVAPLFQDVKDAHAKVKHHLLAECKAECKAAYAQGKVDGAQSMIDTYQAQAADDELRRRLAITGHKGTA